MRAHIYQKAKTAMQSGRAQCSDWVLEFPRNAKAVPDKLMGWQSSGDTMRTVRLLFSCQEEAVAYAQAHGVDYIVKRKSSRQGLRPRAYQDNFAYDRRQTWTH